MYVIFYRGPQGRLAIVANCVFLFKYCINKNKIKYKKNVIQYSYPDKALMMILTQFIFLKFTHEQGGIT